MDENRIYPEASNSLDEMATAMLERNIEYTEDHLHDEDIPTFHVMHSGSEDEKREDRYHYERPPMPMHNDDKQLNMQQ